MNKVAFYLMNTKGLYVLEKFIAQFGANGIEYLVSETDQNVQDDPYIKIKNLANKNGIRFYTRTDFPVEIESNFQGYKFAIGWRWIISSIDKLVVFHDSLLPKYRGFAPLVNSLINKENRGGVTALLASVNYDEGCIIGQKSTTFTYPLKIERAIQLVEPLYFDLVKEIYENIYSEKEISFTEQEHNKATYSLWLDEQDYFIDWTWSAEKIKRFIDAVGYPYDGAKTRVQEQVYRVVDAELIDDVVIEHRQRHLGKIIFMQEAPVVVCDKGLIKLTQLERLDGRTALFNFRSRFE